ncbi:beta-propeller domain-containing protein [Mycoplasmatota bacterium WC44]
MFREIAIIVLALISGIYLIKLIRESRFNYMLKQKQKSMRVYNANIFKRNTLIKVLVPAMSIALIVLFNPKVEYVPSTINSNIQLAKISSKEDILKIQDEFNDNMSSFINYDMVTLDGGIRMESIAESGDASSKQAGDYTETNTQVSGVDEIDNVKTDGTYIYTMNNGNVVVTLAYPATELSVHKRIEFSSKEECSKETCTNEYPSGLYVDDDKLIVITYKNTYMNWKYYEENDTDENSKRMAPSYFWNSVQETLVYVYDKSNDFELTSTYGFEGYMAGTRKIDNNLFIITNTHLNQEKEEMLPTYSINGTTNTCDYTDIIYIEDTNPYNFTNIYGIDLDSEEVDVESILGGSSHNLYVSNESIYTVDQRYYFMPMIEGIVRNESVNEVVTTISRFSIEGNKVVLSASGEVKGNPLNQFSMDEYDGHFRITTTSGWGEEANNRLYVLDENLTIVSELDKLGKPGERLQSTRFMGDIAYLVTFMQTDPFYVVDLQDPTNPMILGELEITGFSSYLHPIDEDHVLGIGFEADKDGRRIGLKISIYDVTDQVDPKEIYKEVLLYKDHGWNYSSVTYNHKDLLFDAKKGIIGFPFEQSNYENNKYSYESGYLLYKFDVSDGLENLGYVTHGEFEDYNHIYKGLFLDDNLYTISTQRIGVSNLEDVEKIQNIIDLYK